MGGSSSSSSTGFTTNNTDRRVAVDGGLGISGDSNSTTFVSTTNSDAAIREIGSAAVSLVGGAGQVVQDLAQMQTRANVDSWDRTLQMGNRLIDQLSGSVTASMALANKAVDSFQPNENKNSQTFMWVGIAAAAALILGKK